jgi:hypothetical protein
MQNYNIAYCYVWVWNLVAYTEGETKAKGIREYGAEKQYESERDGVTGECRRQHNTISYAHQIVFGCG